MWGIHGSLSGRMRVNLVLFSEGQVYSGKVSVNELWCQPQFDNLNSKRFDCSIEHDEKHVFDLEVWIHKVSIWRTRTRSDTYFQKLFATHD